MTTNKNNLLETLKTKDNSGLIQCTNELSVDNVLNDVLAELSQRHLHELWDGVHSMLVEAVQDTNMDCAGTGELLQCIVRLASGTLACQDGFGLALPPSLFEVAVLVHGIFPSLGAEYNSLKDSISRLFENWWLKEGHGREELMGNTLVYLLNKSTGPKATKSDVARVYAVHHVLDAANLDAEGADALVELLLQCCVLPQFLNSPQGVKFVAYLLTLSPDVTKKCHQAIKNHLPAMPVSLHTKFSDVYFRAWQGAKTDMTREVIEHHCIQDLIYRAVHARRGGQCSMAKVLFRVLSMLHKKKTQKGVEAMLTRLYEPILWRSLMAANSDVRINAAVLMFDTFPLQDAGLDREQANSALQKQFDILHSLLSDPVPEVRLVAVQGVGKVLNIYWELIPADVIKCFMTKLIEDLAYDISSPAVREAVLKAMQQLCDNHLCIPLLQKVLPLLQNFVHDTSEKVRIAMFDLLLKVKGLRSIKFWNLVPLEHILSRLQMDSAPIVRRIMKLIYPSFVPLQESAEEQVDRCITLVKLNMAAARQFFLNLPRCLSLDDTLRYITLICRTLIQSARKLNGNSAQSPNGDDANLSKDSGATEKESCRKGASKPNKKLRKMSKKSATSVHVHDSDEEDNKATNDDLVDMVVFRGLVEAVYLMHTVVLNELDAKANKELQESLAKKLSVMVRELMVVSKDPKLDAALVALAGHLPSRALPHVAQNLFKRLKSGSCFDESIDIKLMVKSLVLWGKAGSIIQLVKDSFEDAFKSEKATTSTEKSGNAKQSKPVKKVVAFVAEEPKVSPDLACALIMNMIMPAECRLILLANHRQDLKSLVDTLVPTMAKLDAYFTRNKQIAKKDVELFFEAHTIFLRLTAFLCTRNDNSEETEENDMVQMINRAIVWCHRSVLQHVSGRATDDKDLSTSLLRNVLKICRNLMMIGLANQSFLEATVEFFQAVLRTPDICFTLKCLVVQGVYQLTQVLKYEKHRESDKKTELLDELGCQSIGCVLTSLAKMAIANKDRDEEEDEGCSHDELEELNSEEFNKNTRKFQVLISETADIIMELTVADVNSTVVDKLVTSVLEFVLADSEVNLTQDGATGPGKLPLFTSLLLKNFQKLNILKKVLCGQLQTYLNSERVMTLSQVQGVVLVLEELALDLTDCTSAALYKSIEHLLDKIPTSVDSDKALGDLKRQVEDKLHKTVAANVEIAS